MFRTESICSSGTRDFFSFIDPFGNAYFAVNTTMNSCPVLKPTRLYASSLHPKLIRLVTTYVISTAPCGVAAPTSLLHPITAFPSNILHLWFLTTAQSQRCMAFGVVPPNPDSPSEEQICRFLKDTHRQTNILSHWDIHQD